MTAKWFLIVLMVCLVFPLVHADLDMCEDKLEISPNCRMVTPSLSVCSSLVFEIFNMTGGLVNNGSLVVLNDSIYYFNFTVPSGDYVLSLCDGLVTREVVAVDEGGSMWLAIIVSLLGMTSLFAYFAFNMKSKELRHIKVLMFLLAVVNALFLGFMPFFIASNPINPSTFSPVAIGYFTTNGLLIVVFIWFYAAFLVRRGMDNKGGNDEDNY